MRAAFLFNTHAFSEKQLEESRKQNSVNHRIFEGKRCPPMPGNESAYNPNEEG